MQETALFPGTTTTLTADGTGATANLGAVSSCVRVVSNVDCFVNFKSGSAPTPATSALFLPAFVPEYFYTRTGYSADMYIGVITGGSTGNLYATIMT